MNYAQSTTQDKDNRCGIKCLSWTAIIAGAFVGIGLSFLLNLFGVAIGLSAYTTSTEGTTILAVGAFIGMAIGIMAAMFVSGWVAGFLGGGHCDKCNIGVIYGFVTWALALVLAIILTSSVGQFMAMQYDALTNPNAVALKISSHPATPMVSTTTHVASPSSKATSTQVVVNDEKAAKALGKTVFLIFLLFFVGAITCCFGGYVGVDHCFRCRDKK